VYEKGFGAGVRALIQSESSDRGFVIDCPPDGKGLEAATRLTSEDRIFTANLITYSAAFEEWTGPGNDPWSFVWIRASESSDFPADVLCIVADIDIFDDDFFPDPKHSLLKFFDAFDLIFDFLPDADLVDIYLVE
jgi:hypothetical protein